MATDGGNHGGRKLLLGIGRGAWALIVALVLAPIAGYFIERELSERDEASKSEEDRREAMQKAAEQSRRPLQLTVETDPAVFEKGEPDWTGYAFVIGRPPRAVPAPPRGECRSRRTWAYDLGAVDADFTRVHVTARGRPAAPVRIVDVTVRVHRRRPPLRGAHLACPVGGATGALRGLRVNLDRDPPGRRFLDPRGGRPVTPPYVVSRSEEETFEIEAIARRCYCTWSAQIVAFVNGKRRTVDVRDGARPFRTSPSAESKTVVWERGKWRRFSP
jgi:hypothetical protein